MKNLVLTRATIARRLVLPAAAAAVVGVASLTGAGAASAHVTANAPTVTQGGYGVVTLVVPNESDAAPTTSLRVTLPGLKSARPEVMSGWKSVVTKKDDLVTEITWTAAPGSPGVPVGQFGQFRFSGGPFPEQETVTLPTLQTYADGEKADWNQPTPADGTEPEKPAPTITLAAGGDGHGAHHAAAPEAATDATESQATETAQADSAARWLGGIGLVVGALGTVFGVAALMVARRNGRGNA
ncbi:MULTISPECIES: YcnI family protein [Gordonia]|uniref:YcnI family protein n=1 Tax=Gordonia amicalis TaxID=89053 RepID=A0AAE4U1B3_9ACTN|nr:MULTISPECIES: YcnI family protein [Gordonia]ATD69808.1 nuclear export factor GLE1 [Gordonia sp. 1D]MCR8898977.1 YcnI family protein [Gordonia sp. GONU]MDJ0454196.1 YcnI family protein [Gordonia amicalis]MDV6313429.1 YcnI family protein [Gordonia amicalis]MDV7077890.1 YcnI family protein [Gordonia amicalis]